MFLRVLEGLVRRPGYIYHRGPWNGVEVWKSSQSSQSSFLGAAGFVVLVEALKGFPEGRGGLRGSCPLLENAAAVLLYMVQRFPENAAWEPAGYDRVVVTNSVMFTPN